MVIAEVAFLIVGIAKYVQMLRVERFLGCWLRWRVIMYIRRRETFLAVGHPEEGRKRRPFSFVCGHQGKNNMEGLKALTPG